MVSGKYSALSGAIAREQSISNTSANLANVSTVGYKKARISFESMLRGEKQVIDAKGINYNRISGNYVDFSQGPLSDTGNSFDLAIQGDGFFKIRSGESEFLTRNGNFLLGDDGRLVTDTGMAVLDVGGGEINLREALTSSVVIDYEGRVYTVDPNGEQAEVTQIAVVDVADKSLLVQERDTAFSIPQGQEEQPAQDFKVSQGSLEVSNVNMTDEMSRMIADNRLFEAYHDVLKSYSTIGEKLAELGTLG